MPKRSRLSRRSSTKKSTCSSTENYAEAQQRIEEFIERVYNEKRLHSALDYRPPNEYEQWLLNQQTPQEVAG